MKLTFNDLKKFSWIIWAPLFIYFDLTEYISEELFLYVFYPLIVLSLIYDIYKRKTTTYSKKRTSILLKTNNDSSNKIAQLIFGTLFIIGTICLFLYSDTNPVALVFFLTIGIFLIYRSTYVNKSLSINIEKGQLAIKILPYFEKIIFINELSQIIFTNENIIFVKHNGKKNAVHFLNINESEKYDAIQFLTKKLGNNIDIN